MLNGGEAKGCAAHRDGRTGVMRCSNRQSWHSAMKRCDRDTDEGDASCDAGMRDYAKGKGGSLLVVGRAPCRHRKNSDVVEKRSYPPTINHRPVPSPMVIRNPRTPRRSPFPLREST